MTIVEEYKSVEAMCMIGNYLLWDAVLGTDGGIPDLLSDPSYLV